MTDEVLADEKASVEVTETTSFPPYHPGVPDGTVDSNGEKIVYEYDEAGNHTGWHKEPKEVTE